MAETGSLLKQGTVESAEQLPESFAYGTEMAAKNLYETPLNAYLCVAVSDIEACRNVVKGEIESRVFGFGFKNLRNWMKPVPPSAPVQQIVLDKTSPEVRRNPSVKANASSIAHSRGSKL